MTTDSIKILTGNPGTSKNWSSFSRFTLPFAYQLTPCDPPPKDTLYYHRLKTRPLEDNDTELFSFVKRRKYFTRETGTVLYDKAIWAEVDQNRWANHEWSSDNTDITVTLNKKTISIRMLPPQIILFEACQADNTQMLCSDDTSSTLKTGFLFVDLYFSNENQSPGLDEMLILNESFRYFDIPYNRHATFFQEMFKNIPVSYKNKNNDKLSDHQDNPQKAYFERWAQLLELPLTIDNKTYQLFPESWGKRAREWTYNRYEVDIPMPEHWQVYADNRAYVWTSAILEKGNKTIIDAFDNSTHPQQQTQASTFGHWVKLLNIDNPSFSDKHKTHQTTAFERQWAEGRTYQRWSESGSWYGYSYHSGAMLAPPGSQFDKTWQLQYYDTTLLLFYLRITVFRFSHQLSESIHLRKSKNIDNASFLKMIQQIRRDFSDFTILYQFPLLSNQQQSLEMYELNRKYFELDELFSNVQSEINDTHQFVEQAAALKMTEQANELGEAANKIATIGIPLAAGALIASIFGMSIDGQFGITNCISKGNCNLQPEAAWMILAIFISSIASAGIMPLLKLIKGKKK